MSTFAARTKTLSSRLSKAWSDAARVAALEARRAKGGQDGFVHQMNQIIAREIDYRHRARQQDAMREQKHKAPGVVSKAWSDQARQAALEARRQNAKERKYPTTSLLHPEYAAALHTVTPEGDAERARHIALGAQAAAEFEGPTFAKPGAGKTYVHRTSGKEIVSTRHPGKDWKPG